MSHLNFKQMRVPLLWKKQIWVKEVGSIILYFKDGRYSRKNKFLRELGLTLNLIISNAFNQLKFRLYIYKIIIFQLNAIISAQ